MNVKDIGKKIQNPELLEAMKAVKAKETDYPVARLFEMLAKAVLITPAKFDKEPQPDENGKVVIDSNIKVNFSLLTNQSGEKVLPCFTDEEILNASQFKDGFKKIILPYKQLAEMVYNSNGAIAGIVINPFTENCYISAEFIMDYKENLHRNLIQTKLAPGSKVKLRTPKYQPIQMLEEASKFLAKIPTVNKAYIQMMEEDKKEDKYLIALDMIGDERDVLSGLIPTMRPLAFGIELAFVKIDNPLGQKVVQISKPFYVREGLEDAEGSEEQPQDEE